MDTKIRSRVTQTVFVIFPVKDSRMNNQFIEANLLRICHTE